MPLTPLQKARQIMGRSFIGVDAVTHHLGVRFLARQLENLNKVPFSEKTLLECRETHILAAGYPLSLRELRERSPSGLIDPDQNPWYGQMPFATQETVGLRWYLLRAGILPESTNSTFEEQESLLVQEEIPLACELVYVTVLHYLVNGIRLFDRGELARCQDIVERYGNLVNGGVLVGTFGSEGLRISCLWLRYRLYYVGLASSRILEA